MAKECEGRAKGLGQSGITQNAWQKFPLVGGQTYRLSLWHKSNVPIVIGICANNVVDLRQSGFPEKYQPYRDLGIDWAGDIVSDILPPSVEWKRWSREFTVRPDYDVKAIKQADPSAFDHFDIQLAAQRDGWMIVDDIELVAASQ